MLNYLTLNVFCVLLVNLLGEPLPNKGLSSFQLPWRGRFDIFMRSLGDGIRAGTVEFDTSLKFDSLDRIGNTSTQFRMYCLWAFEKRLKLEKIDYFNENKALLGKFAFAALDSACKAAVKSVKSTLTNDVAYTKELELILYKGDILDFLVFLENPGIPEKNMEREIKRLQKKNGMSKNEAKNRIILHKYNVGKILENYPEPANSIDRQFEGDSFE